MKYDFYTVEMHTRHLTICSPHTDQIEALKHADNVIKANPGEQVIICGHTLVHTLFDSELHEITPELHAVEKKKGVENGRSA